MDLAQKRDCSVSARQLHANFLELMPIFLELIPRNPQQLLVQGFFCLLLCLSVYLFDSFICIAAVRIHSN